MEDRFRSQADRVASPGGMTDAAARVHRRDRERGLGLGRGADGARRAGLGGPAVVRHRHLHRWIAHFRLLLSVAMFRRKLDRAAKL